MIIIKTPQPDIEERLVVVPPSSISNPQPDGTFAVSTTAARDATPADLERAGYVPVEETRADGAVVPVRRWENGIRAIASLFIGPRDEFEVSEIVAKVKKSEHERAGLAEAANEAYDERDKERTRAEKAERERDEEKRHAGDAADALARLMRERDAIRAKLARLTAPAPAEGEPSGADLRALVDREGLRIGVDAALVAVWRAGVAHERARHGEPRATDEDLVGVYTHGYDAHANETRDPLSRSHYDCKRAAVAAVAARVRQERCLVAQAVGTNVDIRVCEDDGGGFMVGVHAPGCDEELTRYVPPADVPATLARLLGEVSRG